MNEIAPIQKNIDIPELINVFDAKINLEPIDNYTEQILRQQYELHKNYTNGRLTAKQTLNVNFRLPSIPEDISENIIKFILHKLNDKTVTWNCNGDLLSKTHGILECKCFTSDGPLSFSPTPKWNVLYVLDAKDWLNDKFVLWKVSLPASSETWKNTNMNKNETFAVQCNQKRRPRINWKLLHPQIAEHCQNIFDGSFEQIFANV